MMTEPGPLLEARGLLKRFGGVVALREGNFDLRSNEVHAIVGDNGAGKTTLIKILSGAHQPDAGEILLDGRPVTIPNPQVAHKLGIATVFQDLALVNHLDVSGNLFLGREELLPPPLCWLGFFSFINKRAMRRRAEEEMGRLKIAIPSVDHTVARMSGGQRQAIAVGRAIVWGTRIVIMDEPTAALGVRESGAVRELIGELRAQGLAVIMISHNMPEVLAVADRITVFRLGRRVATVTRENTDHEALVGLITGAVGATA